MPWRWILVVLALVGGWRHFSGTTEDAGIDDAVRARLGKERIVMFTATWCGYCRMLKQDMKNAGVAYREIDVDSDPGSYLFADVGGRGVPVTVVGEEIVHGYDPSRVFALINASP